MNWGNKLLVTFLIFGAGMIYLVYRSMHTEFELVEKDYYKTELSYQQVIDAKKRSQTLQSQVQWQQTLHGLEMKLPAEMKTKELKGSIWFYCAYNSVQDRKVSLQVNENAVQHFPDSLLMPGTYTAKISWEDGAEQYYTESRIDVK